MRKRSQRLWLIGAAAVLMIGAVALAATALGGSLAFYYGPTDLVEKNKIKPGFSARVGGLVKAGSVKYGTDGKMEFDITDEVNTVHVVYAKQKPDMFAENQGIVAVGKFDGAGNFVASNVLAKHDETYIPKEVYDNLKKRAGEKGVEDYQKGKAAQPEGVSAKPLETGGTGR